MKNGSGTPQSWKGAGDQVVVEPVRHRWQSETTSLERSLIKSQRKSLRARLVGLSFILLGLMSALVVLLLWGPSKTPLISVAAVNYNWPLPPNAWAFEDVQGFAFLQSKNIDWRDASPRWQTNATALGDLRQQVASVTNLAERTGTLVLYLSMHGAVNDQREPCLIPAGASPLAPDQWIRLSDVVGLLPRSSTGVHSLVVLDCIDQQVNWNVGLVDSTFAQRVIDWVNEQDNGNFSVLLSAAPQQQSWSGPELQSSIFGKSFRMAMCGAADDAQLNTAIDTTASGSGHALKTISHAGNEDGVVSLYELVNYVAREVAQWSTEHRATKQTPLFLTKASSDCPVARTLSNRELKRMTTATAGQTAAATPAMDEMAALWRMLDKLREQNCYSFEPRAWSDLEHQLLWLEKLSTAGSGYTEQASRKLYPELTERLKECLARATNVPNENLLARSKVLTNQPALRLDKTQLPSLSWLEYASAEAIDVAALRAQVSILATSERTDELQGLLAGRGITPDMLVPNELNFAALLQRQSVSGLWLDQASMREALELRQRCEQLAVQGDVRSHRLRRVGLQKLDALRRRVEDRLFQGQPSSGAEPLGLDELKQAVEQALTDQKLTDEALRVRDHGVALAAYMAAWICSPHNDMRNLGDWLAKDGASPTSPSQGTDASAPTRIDPLLRERMAIQRLDRLVKNSKDISDLLKRTPQDGLADLSELKKLSDQTRLDIESMQLLVADHVKRARARAVNDSANVAQLDALLELPFLSADDRLAIRKKLDEHLQNSSNAKSISSNTPKQPGELLNALQKQAGSVANSVAGADSSAAREQQSALEQVAGAEAGALQYNQRMNQWPVHPLAGLIGLNSNEFALTKKSESAEPEASGSPELNRIDGLNARIRSYYLAVASLSTKQLSAWSGDDSTVGQPRGDAWSEAVTAASVDRMLLPICPVHAESDATAYFIGVAMKDEIRWYARRTLDDFYADGRKSSSAPVDEPAYFDQVTQRLLQASAQLPSLDDDEQAGTQLTNRLEILRALARNGLRASIKTGVPDPDGKRVRFELDVQSTLTSSIVNNAKALWPAGTAVAYLRNEGGPLPADRAAVEIPVATSGARAILDSSALDRNANNVAVVSFRGHEFQAPLFVGAGVVVDYEPTQFDWAQVALFGDRVQQPSIVFILDCSWSMGEPLPVEALDATTQSRLELAKTHVLRLVEQLALTGDARLGVRLFGHRLGWSRPVDPKTGNVKGTSQVIPQPNYLRSIPDDMVPSRDVEAIVPLGRFAPEMIGGLNKTLASVIPWGQSPLYLSIVEAFKDFGADNQTTTKSIVVITDGDNFQFNSSRQPGGDSGSQTSMDEVLTAWQSTKVPLFILGVGIEEGSDKTGNNARANLKKLAERTGGQYYDIGNGSELLKALAEQTSTATYTLETLTSSSSRKSNSDEEPPETRLNELTEIRDLRGPRNLRLTFQSITKDLTVQGGESLELYVSDDGQDIRSRPYDVHTPKSGILAHAGDPNLIVRAHRPLPQSGGVLFPISFQDPQSHFTPRPVETWIDVTPVRADGQALRSSYVFYDTNYEARTPVPRQSWLASDWPAAATAADIRVWARYNKSPASAMITMQQLREEASRWSIGAPAPGLTDVTLRINVVQASDSGSWQLQVTEIHGPQSRGIGSVRIQLDSGGQPKPSRVTRRFDTESRLAIHSFEYTASAGAKLLESDSAQLTIATRENALDGGYQLQGGQAIRVEITQSSDLLPVPNPNPTR